MAKKAATTEQSLESIMWNCRNALRGTVGGNDKNRDAVMGLVFLKFAGDKFDKRRKEITEQYGDVPAFLEKKSFYLSENVFYLNETSRWNHIVTNASADDIAVIIDKAMKDIEDGESAFERHSAAKLLRHPRHTSRTSINAYRRGQQNLMTSVSNTRFNRTVV